MMSHQLIDELQSRSGEKVAPFLTMQRATGLIIGVAPTFLISFRSAWWLCLILTAVGAVLGLLATAELRGMVLYERVIADLRGRIAARLHPQRITPAELSGARQIGQRDAAIPLDGAVRVVQSPRATAIARLTVPASSRVVSREQCNGQEGRHADPTAP
jgi:hypothetical protein